MGVPEAFKFHESTESQFRTLSNRVRGWIGGNPVPDDQELLLEALQLSRKIDPIALLSFATLQAMAGHRSSSGYLGDRALQQCHLELFHGLILTLPLGSYARNGFITDANSWAIFDLIRDSLFAFSVNFHKDEYTENNKNNAVNSIINDARQETLFVRNQGFGQHILALISRLFSPVDTSMKAALGYTANEVMEFVVAIWKCINQKASKYYTKLDLVCQNSTRATIWAEFCQQFGLSDKEKRQLREKLDPNLDEQGLFNALHTATSNRCARVFTFTFRELKDLCPSSISEDTLIKLLDKLALRFGDLHDFDKNHFFLGNPVWVKPIIKLTDKEYYFAGLGEFFSFPLEIFLWLLKDEENILKHFHQAKGKILEAWILDEVGKYFPAQDIYSNVTRTMPTHGEDGENDIVVFTDQMLLLIEAKSGEAEPGALRGGYPALKASLEHLTVEPGIQSSGFVEFLNNHPGSQRFSTGDANRDLLVDKNDIRRVIRLSITLDGLGTLAATLLRLKSAGIAERTWHPAPCMSLIDFLMCTELLDSAPQLLHYIASREALEKIGWWRADEQDFLSLYLKNGFSELSASPGGEHELYGESQFIFDYFYNQFKGTPSPRPKISLSETWGMLCKKANEAREPNWTEGILFLLSVPRKHQRDIEKLIKQLTANSLASGSAVGASFPIAKSDIPELAKFAMKYTVSPNKNDLTCVLEAGLKHPPTIVMVRDCAATSDDTSGVTLDFSNL